jgi:hypothetical protein
MSLATQAAGPATDFILFFNAATTDSDSAAYTFAFPNKKACLKYWGTWDGASIEFQTLTPPIAGTPSTYWVPIMFITGQDMFTADGQVTLENVVYYDTIRCVISGAGGSTSISVTAQAL